MKSDSEIKVDSEMKADIDIKTDTKLAIIDSHSGFDNIWFSWQIGGLMPIGKKFSINILYAVAVNFFILIYFPLSMTIDICLEPDLKTIIGNLAVMLTIIALSIKYYIVLVYKSHLYNIKEILKTLDKRAIHEDEKECLRKGIKLCQQMFRIFIFTFYSSGSFFVIAPLFSPNKLIFPAWFPFDPRGKINYYIVYIYQAVALGVLIIENIANDIFPPAYICVLCSQIQALGLRIRRIGQDSEITQADHYKELVACIHDHRAILDMFKEISTIVVRTLGLQFIVSGFVLCIGVINAFYFSTEIFKILADVMYLGCVILEVLPICYSANRLLEINEELSNAIFGCNWVDQEMKFKRTIQIFLQQTQTPLIMLAGNIIPVTLPTFLGIVKFSFSLFTILMQINS